MASVTTPMKVRMILSPLMIGPVISWAFDDPKRFEGALVGRVVTIPLRQEFADLLGGLRLERRRRRLPDERVDVLVVRQPAHGRPRNEDAELVGPVVVRQLDFLFTDANNLEPLAADADGFPDGWNRSEELPLYLNADKGHPPAQPHVFFLKETSAWLRHLAPHAAVRGGDGANEVTGLPVGVHDRKVAHELGADVLDERHLADRQHVVHRHADAFAGAFAAGLQARLAGEHNHGAVGVGALETGVDRAAKAVAVRQEDNDGDDAPRNAEHREGGPKAVVVEAVTRLADDLAQGGQAHFTSRIAEPRPAAERPHDAPDTST